MVDDAVTPTSASAPTGGGVPPLLELRAARVVRDGATILAVDQFAISEGERLAIMGPNGAGKTTLIKLLTHDVLPVWADPPPVLFRGEPRPMLADARAHLGVVSADAQEQARVALSALEVVLGGFFGSLGVPTRRHPTPLQLEQAGIALRELGVDHLADHSMTTLSTGEARRVLFARALVYDPPVLVLDEPMSGLDPHARLHVRDAVRTLASSGRALVLVTHHVEDIVPEIDRIVMMKGACIIADGSKRELLTSARLGELFDMPAELEERDGEYRLW